MEALISTDAGWKISECPYCRAAHNLPAIDRTTARRLPAYGINEHGPQANRLRAERCDSPGVVDDRPPRRSRRQPHVTAPDIKRARRAIASFLCDMHFLRAFPSRDDTTSVTFGAARFVPASHISRQNNAVRELSHAVCSPTKCGRCADAQIKRSPYASQKCPCPAQNGRALVQPRTPFAVFSCRRVKGHTSRLTRAHHQRFPKLSGETFRL